MAKKNRNKTEKSDVMESKTGSGMPETGKGAEPMGEEPVETGKGMALHQRVEITQEIRDALYQKRTALGMSYTMASEYIGVHWSTYRKWEIGKTSKFTRNVERRVMRFLEEDIPFNKMSSNPVESSSRTLEKLIHRLRSTYRLCQNQPSLQERLTLRLENLIDEMLNVFSQNM